MYKSESFINSLINLKNKSPVLFTMNPMWVIGTGADMNIRNMEAYLKESSNLKDLDPNLWERLIWQEALDKAIHKKKDRRIGPNTVSAPTQDQKTE